MTRRILPVLFAVILTLALLEVGACAYLKAFRGYDGEHLMNYEFDPYKNIRPTPGYVDTRGVYHNAQGFRRREDVLREKPTGTIRVFLMGGSTAYGLRSLSQAGMDRYPVIRNDETIDHYLEELLQRRFPEHRVQVINAAVTSFFSHHHLIYLNQKVLEYDPDVVIFLDGFNDYYPYKAGFDQWRDYADQERSHVFLGEPTVAAWAYYSSWWLVRKSAAAHLAGHGLRNLWYMIRPVRRIRIEVDDAIETLHVNARRNWVQMVERNGLILRHENVDAIFALQPEIVFEQSKDFSPLEERIYEEMATQWPENFIDYKNRALPIVRRYLAEAAAVSGAHVADLTDIYDEVQGDAYTDYCHLTPTGNRVLAEHLEALAAEVLRARLAAGMGPRE